MGLMRGYSATGDFKTALKYAKMAEPQVTDPQSEAAPEGHIRMLSEGKDVN